jgi:hypothetical protein
MGGGMSWNPYAGIQRVAFELSNRCVNAKEHARCPAHLRVDDAPANLPARHVSHVLETFHANIPGFKGFVYFHLYNEPLADPRLLGFVGLTSAALPRALIQITTSGWNLDQVLLDELAKAGARAVRVSIYDKATLNRAYQLREPKGLKLIHDKSAPADWRGTLRTDIPAVYETAPTVTGKRCRAPLRQLCVGYDGRVLLCCQDWARTITFGSLDKSTLDAILYQDSVAIAYTNLSKGNRLYDVCKRCPHVD